MKVELILEVFEDGDLWLRREEELPEVFVGMGIDLCEPCDSTIFDFFLITSVSWIKPRQCFECFVEMTDVPNFSEKQLLKKLFARGWKEMPVVEKLAARIGKKSFKKPVK